jgi:DnaJ like chaperone protein
MRLIVGKVIGGLFGSLLGGIFGSGLLGLMLGIWLGHRFDVGLAAVLTQGGVWQFGFNQTHSESQQVFFDVTFSVMGHLSKADGVVSQREIQIAEHMMTQLNMGVVARRAAMEAFRRGKQPGFDCDAACAQLMSVCHHNTTLIRLFLDIQLQMTLADGVMGAAKQAVFEKICACLNVTVPHFGFSGGGRSQRGGMGSGPSRPPLSESYVLLGVRSNVSDADVKKAYRRQMAAHHPDRLIAKGLPAEMIKVATEKTQAIRAAYERIKEQRGMN